MIPRPDFQSPLVEPLTARELEILRHMADGTGFRNIATRLHLSPTTVKWYSQQIYSKLGIDHAGQKRRLAVARARALGLLEPSQTSTGRPRYSLPVQTRPFVGRKQELDDLAALLADPAIRLVTLFGPGGIGKTRLAVELAWRLAEPAVPNARIGLFPDGVYFVPLQALQSAEQVLWAIASAVGYTFPHGEPSPREQLLSFFAEKRLLLVLDNFEHVLDSAPVVTDILRAASGVKVLATSREVLNLSAETVYAVDGLSRTPGTHPDQVTTSDAGRLFVQSAQRTLASFELRPEDEPWLRRICQQVEGMPLAIILAAAWVTTLSLPEIAEDILCCPEFLAAKMPDVPPRQWSIRALFEPTWERLSAAEQSAFMRLAVFQSGGRREAIQAVTGASLPVLQGLMKKAVLSRTPDGRYRLHEMLRQFVEERLLSTGDIEPAHDAHCAYYARFIQDRAADLRGGARQLAALAEIDADIENVRLAWQWAVDHQRADDLMRMEWSFGWFLYIRARAVEGLALYQRALDQVDDRALRGRLMARIGRFCEQLGRRREGLEWTRQSVAIEREQDEPWLLAFALRQLGVYSAAVVNDFDEAHTVLDESLAIWNALGDEWGEGVSWFGKAVAFRWEDDTPAALAFTEKGLVQTDRAGDRFMSAMGYLNAGVDHMQLSNQQEAIRHFEESLARYRALNAPSGMANALGNLGVVHEHVGEYDVAMQRYEEALVLAREYSHREIVVGNLLNITELLASTGKFDQARERLAEVQEIMASIEPYRLIAWGMLAETRISFRQGDYEAALRLARDALDSSQAANRQKIAQRSSFVRASHTAIQSRLWIALIATKLGQLDIAHHHLRASLPELYYSQYQVLAVYTLAELSAARGERCEAAIYAAAVERHAAARYEIRCWAGDLLADLSRSLAPEDFAGALARGAALDLNDAVAAYGANTPQDTSPR